jgi:CubicO group peptidase (beta-lactamase class C family)
MRRVRELIESGIAEGLHLGGEVVVWQHGREILGMQAGEMEPGRPLTAAARWSWLSGGKPLTAVLIGLLAQEGELSLSDRVARFVPGFAGHGKEAITLRHLLSHTSGLAGAIASNWEIRDWQAALRQISEYALPRGWVVGSSAGYDPVAAWMLLGEVAQRVSATSFESLMRTRVLQPLGMTDTAFTSGDSAASLAPMFDTLRSARALAAGGAGRAGDHASARPVRLEWSAANRRTLALPGASAQGPLRDLVRFYEGLRRGELLQAPMLRELTSGACGVVYDHTFRRPLDWGLGFLVDNGPDAPYGAGALSRAGVFGHGGQQSSVAFCDPQRQLVVAVIFNGLCGEGRHHKRQQAVLQAIAGEAGLV